MNNDYNIDELAKFICMGKHSDLPCHEECKKKCEFRERAKAISDAGYRKQVWHKVADGDLPETCIYVIVVHNYGISIGMLTDNSTWELLENPHYEYPVDKVIVWTELPKYKE